MDINILDAVIHGMGKAAEEQTKEKYNLELEYNKDMFNKLWDWSDSLMKAGDPSMQQAGMGMRQTLSEKGHKAIKDIIKGFPNFPTLEDFTEKRLGQYYDKKLGSAYPEVAAQSPAQQQPQFTNLPKPVQMQFQMEHMARQALGPEPPDIDISRLPRDAYGNYTAEAQSMVEMWKIKKQDYQKKYDTLLDNLMRNSMRPGIAPRIKGDDPRLATLGIPLDPDKDYRVQYDQQSGEFQTAFEIPKVESEAASIRKRAEAAWLAVQGPKYGITTKEQMESNPVAQSQARIWWNQLEAGSKTVYRDQLRQNQYTGDWDWIGAPVKEQPDLLKQQEQSKQGTTARSGRAPKPAATQPQPAQPKPQQPAQPAPPAFQVPPGVNFKEAAINHAASPAPYNPKDIFDKLPQPRSKEESAIRALAWQMATGNQPKGGTTVARTRAAQEFMMNNGLIAWNNESEFKEFRDIGQAQKLIDTLIADAERVIIDPSWKGTRMLGAKTVSIKSLFSKQIFREAGMLTENDIKRAGAMAGATVITLPWIGPVSLAPVPFIGQDQSLINLYALRDLVKDRKQVIIENKLGNFNPIPATPEGNDTLPQSKLDEYVIRAAEVMKAHSLNRPTQQALPSPYQYKASNGITYSFKSKEELDKAIAIDKQSGRK